MDAVRILAVFIPILFVIGLFTTISLNAYFKYKTNTVMSERVPLESLGEWYKSNALARALRSRAGGIRIGGLLIGIGLGTAIGCIVLASGAISDVGHFDRDAIATFLVISLAMFCGGIGMAGAYFLERKLDGKMPK